MGDDRPPSTPYGRPSLPKLPMRPPSRPVPILTQDRVPINRNPSSNQNPPSTPSSTSPFVLAQFSAKRRRTNLTPSMAFLDLSPTSALVSPSSSLDSSIVAPLSPCATVSSPVPSSSFFSASLLPSRSSAPIPVPSSSLSAPSPVPPCCRSSSAIVVDKCTPNPHNELAKSNIYAHVDSLFSELSNRVGSLITNSPPREFPRFTHCDKTLSLIKTMAELLSPANPLISLHLTKSQVCNLLSFLTGIHPRQIDRIVAPTIDLSVPLHPFCPPCHPPVEKMSSTQRDLQVFGDETRVKMRFWIHAQFREQKRPSVEMIVKAAEYWLQGEDTGKMVCATSVRKCMRAMGFSWRKLTTRCHMFLNPGISSLRNAYLSIMRNLRAQTGKDSVYIAFLDETWLYPGMRHAYGWVDNVADNDPFLAMSMGLTPGLEAEFKKGERLVLIGVFSEHGFIHYKVYRTGKKEDESSRDYHGEMNAKVFEAYLDNACIELVKRSKEKDQAPVLVIDNAAYHGRRLEAMPTKSSTKGNMVEFLKRKNLPFDPKWKKPELWSKAIAPLDKRKYNIYATEEIAKKHGVRIVRLPPYHCLYSPIELGWAWLKNKAKDQLTADDVGAVAQTKVEKIFDSFPSEKAPSYMDHCRKKEEDHIAKGSLTFSHADLDPHAFVRAQMRADRELDSVPALDEDEEVEEEAMEKEDEEEQRPSDEAEEEESEIGGGWDENHDDSLYEDLVIEEFN